ncbi:MAG: hypothetical protein ACYC67_08850 [Prosthecobacter sp.]
MLRRILAKRFVRILLWLFITLVTLVVLLRVWTNWSGRRRWAATKAMIEHEGETLDFRKLLPETPPDAENLLAMEPLRDLTEAIDHDDAKGEPGAKRKALTEMKMDVMASGARGVEKGQVTDMQTWAKYLRESKFLDLPAASAAPGREVLAALDAKFPLLKQLSDLAPQRSQAMFIPGLRERELPEMLFSISLRHYTGARHLARLLCLRARAAIDAKQGAEAVHSLLAAEKIGFACETEPLLIGCLVGLATETLVNESLWVGLRDRAFSEAELQSLQSLLSAHDLDKVVLQAFRGELACVVSSMEYLKDVAAGRKQSVQGVAAIFSDDHQNHSLRRLSAGLPGGFFHHSMSVVAELEWKHALSPLRQGGIMAVLKAGDGMNADLNVKKNYLLHPEYVMASFIIPSFTTISASAALVQARERQALTAIALERFFLKHAKYPAALQELVPDFVAAVPRDPWDAKELRYRTTPAGRYTLWCVGLDGVDDGGQVYKNGVAMRSTLYLGDWTWQYEPAKTGSKK